MDLTCFLRVGSFHWFLAEGKTAGGFIEQCRRNYRPSRDSSSLISLPTAARFRGLSVYALTSSTRLAVSFAGSLASTLMGVDTCSASAGPWRPTTSR